MVGVSASLPTSHLSLLLSLYYSPSTTLRRKQLLLRWCYCWLLAAVYVRTSISFLTAIGHTSHRLQITAVLRSLIFATCFVLLASAVRCLGDWKVESVWCSMYVLLTERAIAGQWITEHEMPTLPPCSDARWLLLAILWCFAVVFPTAAALCSLLCVLCVLVCSWTVARSMLRKAAKTSLLGVGWPTSHKLKRRSKHPASAGEVE